MYKEWEYSVKGNSCDDNFDVTFRPYFQTIFQLASFFAKEEQRFAFENKCRPNLEFYETLEVKWFCKIQSIEIHKKICQPCGFLTSFEKRKNEVEAKAIQYIDSELGDFISWLKKHPEKIQ